jgi:hypothetical protein
MKTSNSEVKSFIWKITHTTGNTKPDGSPETYTAYPSRLYRAFHTLDKALRDQTLIGIYDKEIPKDMIKIEDVAWVPYTDFVIPPGKAIMSDKFNDEELDLEGMKDLLKWAYGNREEIPLISIEALDEFEELLK